MRYRLLLLAASIGVDDVDRRTIVAGQIGKQVFESDVAGTAIAKRESVDRLISDILATLQLNRRYTLFTGKRAMPVTVDSATCLYTVLAMCGASAQVALPLLRRSIRDPEALSGEEAVRTYVSIQMEVDRQRVFELIGELLGERDASLILRGLAMAAEVPDVDPNVLNRISALTRHSDPQVREAAISLEARD